MVRRVSRKPHKAAIDPAVLRAIEVAAERAATRATKKFLLALGINATKPEDVIESQKDSNFTRTLRLGAESKSAKISISIIGLVFSIAGYLVISGIHWLVDYFRAKGLQ